MFGKYSYLAWMLIFTLIPIGVLWLRYPHALWRNRHVIALTACIAVLYQLLVDPIAEKWHAWFFDERRVMGIWMGNFPIENTIFFALIAVAISSFVVSRLSRNK